MRSSVPDAFATTARSYDESAASWHEAHRAEDRAVSRAGGFDRFAALMKLGGLVLDLGCGSGLDAPALAERGFRLIGLDSSVGMLRIARSVPALAGRLVQGDMRALPLADGAVDAVWADGSLHHVPKNGAVPAVREAARVLRTGGLFSGSAERGTLGGFVENQEGVAGRRWYSYCEPDEFREVVVAAGFTVVEEFVGGPAAHTAGFVALSARKR